jgi:hypothetical protein
MPETLLFPEFLYGELSPTQRKMKAEAKKWGKRYAKSGDFPEPKLMPVPPGSIVFWNRSALDLMKWGGSTEKDPEWEKVCLRAGRHVPRWHLHHLTSFRSEIPKPEGDDYLSIRARFREDYEAFVCSYPWGAIAFAIEQPYSNPIPVAMRRIDALLSFWEPLDTIRYVSYDLYPVSLTHLVRRAYRTLLAMWVDQPTVNVTTDLRSAIINMANASEDEIHARILRSAHWVIENWRDVKQPEWLKSPGRLENELERIRLQDPEEYAELGGSGGARLVGNLDRVGPEGPQP